MPKITFASDQLPAELDDDARYALWCEIYTSRYGNADIARLEDRPFSSYSEFMQIGGVGIIRCDGTFKRYARTAQHAAADTRGDFLIGIQRGHSPMTSVQRGREIALGKGELTLYTNADAYECGGNDQVIAAGLCLPRELLLERVANADDLVIRPLDPSLPAVTHLGRYIDFLLASDEIAADVKLASRIGETLLDLVALSLGANGDTGAVAQMRGLRAARAQEVAADINLRFADPAYSPRAAAQKLGLSPRYIQDLLQETGTSFTERVLELRLQKARTILAAPRHSRQKISDIALACGFGNVSYFNQRFRRRFGASPTQYRAGKCDT